MGIVISVINNKGGCGKTTTTVNLAVALSRLQKKVLVVDLDSQSNTTDCFRDSITGQIGKTMFDLLDPQGAPNIEDCVYNTDYHQLYLLPNISDTAIHGPTFIKSGQNALNILKDRLRPYAVKNYDFTIIDCPPNLEVFVISALTASDFVIVPCESGSKFSVQGLIKAKQFIDDIKEEYNPDLRFLRLLITKADHRTQICKSIISAIHAAFPTSDVFETIIPANTDFQKAEAKNQSIFKFRIGAPGAAAYTDVAKELIKALLPETAKSRKSS
jgi:cellulose biosynthesis protein BcsQ